MMKLKLPKPPRLLVTVASLAAFYLFAALEITADELYGAAKPSSTDVYFFPIIGPYHLWPAWVMVFTALAITFFCAWLLGYAYRASQPEPQKTWILRTNPPDYYPTVQPASEEPDEPPEPASAPQPPKPEVPRGTKPLGLDDL